MNVKSLTLGAMALLAVNSCMAGAPAFAENHTRAQLVTLWKSVTRVQQDEAGLSAVQAKARFDDELARAGISLPATFLDPQAAGRGEIYGEVTLRRLEIEANQVIAVVSGPRLDGGRPARMPIFTEKLK